LIFVAGDKRTEYYQSSYSGRTIRIWDRYPYPDDTDAIYMVFTDIDGLAMATADPEKNNLEFITDKECPIIWYFMDTDISRQGHVIVDAIDEIQESFNGRRIRMIWQPMNGKTAIETFYKRDILEIADTMVKIREKTKRSDLDIRAGLATSWYPSGKANHLSALRIARLNLAIELFSYYWLRARCIDLSKLTTVHRKSKLGVYEEIGEDEMVNIRGYEDEKFSPRNYRDPRRYPMVIAFFPARRAREILRKVFQIYGVEPDWEKARNARDTNWRIETPAVYTGGKFEELPMPKEGERTYLDISARISFRLRFEKEQNYEGVLPSLQLAEYPWSNLNTQSLDESLPLVTDIQEFSLSTHNQVLDEHIPRTQITHRIERIERIERRIDREGESSTESLKKTTSALDRLGPRVKKTDLTTAPGKEKEYDSWGDEMEEEEANQTQELEDPCPIEPLGFQSRSPRTKTTEPETKTSSEGAREVEPEPKKRTARRIESEPSKRVRDTASPSVEILSESEPDSQSQDESSDESEISSSSDEEERKERRVRALLSFLDCYDEKERLRLKKKQKLKKQWEKARKLRQEKKKEQKK
jgi:hypothetical protein